MALEKVTEYCLVKNDGSYYYGELKSLDTEKHIGWIKFKYEEPVVIGKKTYDERLSRDELIVLQEKSGQ